MLRICTVLMGVVYEFFPLCSLWTPRGVVIKQHHLRKDGKGVLSQHGRVMVGVQRLAGKLKEEMWSIPGRFFSHTNRYMLHSVVMYFHH